MLYRRGQNRQELGAEREGFVSLPARKKVEVAEARGTEKARKRARDRKGKKAGCQRKEPEMYSDDPLTANSLNLLSFTRHLLRKLPQNESVWVWLSKPAPPFPWRMHFPLNRLNLQTDGSICPLIII